jgi:hypothetical protein
MIERKGNPFDETEKVKFFLRTINWGVAVDDRFVQVTLEQSHHEDGQGREDNVVEHYQPVVVEILIDEKD